MGFTINLSGPSVMESFRARPYVWISALLASAFLIRLVNAHTRRKNGGLPYPPGPKGYFIIGNLLSLPVRQAWKVYKEWGDIYGDMIYFEVVGQPFLVLGSEKRINDLLEKRSANYSSRPRMPMVLELMGWNYNLGLLPYGDRWRHFRREFRTFFGPNTVLDYHPIQEQEAHVLLRRLLASPEEFLSHLRIFFGSLIMRISYGIPIESKTNPYIVAVQASLKGFHEVGIPGQFWVDFFPVLKYMPSWMPGAQFKRKAAYWSSLNDITQEKPFRQVLENIQNGAAMPSIASKLISDLPDDGEPDREEEEKVARNLCATGFLSGSDTTVSSGNIFFLAMAMHPGVQKKAHAELDSVLEQNRLPTFEDRPRLPYLNAVIKETLRWLNVAPLGLYHASTNDDEYDGYFIPKGTIIMTNIWSILHNPAVYEDPFTFNPERFLRDGQLVPDAPQPEAFTFGAGRRVCPGRYLGEDVLYILMATVLSAFNISQSIDASGKPVELTTEMEGNFVCYPVPFRCTIKPRFAAAERLIGDSQHTGV